MKAQKLIIPAFILFVFVSSNVQAQKKDNSDEMRISVQGICPVSGNKLGSMGTPVKIKLGEESAFLCCKGCVGKQVKIEHWKKVHANLAAAQQTCPIMKKPVDSKMKSTIVNGQRVFVCCPPCIEKIQKSPETSLTFVNANYKSYVEKQVNSNAEELHIAAQAICPVTGEMLGTKGKPVKVKVGKEHIYVANKECLAKKIDLNHWKTIQANLAKAQGICPIMKKPVDAKMEYTVINGRKIFVCCPPCIEKIEAKPNVYVTELNKLYMKSNSALK